MTVPTLHSSISMQADESAEMVMGKLKRQTGISLLEILVVLVLLLIGFFSLIRLFPPGFLVNQQTEAATLASRLAKQEIERYTSTAANLMTAIVPILPVANPASPAGYSFVVDLNVTPDDLSERTDRPFGIDPYYISGVNKIRRILGETVRVPVPSPIGVGVRGSIYVLSAGPVYNVDRGFYDPRGDLSTVESIYVSGAPLIRRVLDAESAPDPVFFLRGPASYAIDYDSAKIAFFEVDYPRQFLISFSYRDASEMVQSVVDQVIDVPANYGGWLDVPVPGGRPLVPDSEVVARKFRKLSAPTWSRDPYEYVVLSSNLDGPGGFANVGVLAFNPLGHDHTEMTSTGPQPLTARIDYDLLDWHIIREDRPMPSARPYRMRTTLKEIKERGEILDDQTTYTGILHGVDSPDLLIYDLTTGLEVPRTDPSGRPNYYVDYKEGLVTFNDEFVERNGLASRTFRLFYKAKGDWALQIQKACADYRRHRPSTAGDEANVGFCEFYVGMSPLGTPRIYFPLTEAGKTITIREIWYLSENRRTGLRTLRRATNETYRIEDQRIRFEPVSTAGGARTLTYIDLTEKHNSEEDTAVGWPPANSPVEPVAGVRGISFKARVLRQNGRTVVTTPTGNVVRTRWLKTDIDTLLARSPS